MPKNKKKEKKIRIKNKNKNQINITINSNNKRKVASRPSSSSGHSSVFVSTPNQPYVPQNDSLFHLYPILENLKDKIDKINTPVSNPVHVPSSIQHEEVVRIPKREVKKEVIDVSSEVNDSILNHGIKETKKELALKLDKISGNSLNYTRTSPYSSLNSLPSSVSGYSSDTGSMPSELTPIARRTRQRKTDVSVHSHIPQYAHGSARYYGKGK